MGKLRMKVDDLRVESFATLSEAGDPGGTVYARGDVLPSPDIDARTLGATCNATCPDTCRESCHYFDGCTFESCGGSCPMQGTCWRTCVALQCQTQVEARTN